MQAVHLGSVGDLEESEVRRNASCSSCKGDGGIAEQAVGQNSWRSMLTSARSTQQELNSRQCECRRRELKRCALFDFRITYDSNTENWKLGWTIAGQDPHNQGRCHGGCVADILDILLPQDQLELAKLTKKQAEKTKFKSKSGSDSESNNASECWSRTGGMHTRVSQHARKHWHCNFQTKRRDKEGQIQLIHSTSVRSNQSLDACGGTTTPARVDGYRGRSCQWTKIPICKLAQAAPVQVEVRLWAKWRRSGGDYKPGEYSIHPGVLVVWMKYPSRELAVVRTWASPSVAVAAVGVNVAAGGSSALSNAILPMDSLC